MSDHSFIHCNLNMAKPMRKGTLITHHDLKKIDHMSLKENLQVVCNHVVASDLHDMVTEYNTNLAGILESHAPLNQKECRSCHNQPWFNDRIKDEIKIHRNKEEKFREDPSAYNYQAFYNQRHYMVNLIHQSQQAHFRDRLMENKYDTKATDNLTNKLLFLE